MLEDAFRRVHNHVADELCGRGTPIFVGGKSLGGRVAAELISLGRQDEGLVASGLIVLGYPLHAPGRKDRLRVDPLRRIAVPSLFCVGSRDPLCDTESLRPILAGLSYPGELFVLQGGDHSLVLSSASRRRPEDGYDDVARKMAAFVGRRDRYELSRRPTAGHGAGGARSAANSGLSSEPSRANVVPAKTRAKPSRVRRVRVS